MGIRVRVTARARARGRGRGRLPVANLGLQRGLQRAPVGLQPRGVVAADVRVVEPREGERLAQHPRRVVLCHQGEAHACEEQNKTCLGPCLPE